MRKFFGISVVLACSGLAYGQVWNEVGDAGELPGTAQTPIGSGALTTIFGERGPGADMFLIRIVDAVNFEARTWPGSNGDTQLFLFDLAGNGVTHNDDDSPNGLLSRITGQFLSGPGDYYLAISSYNYDPENAAGQLIWNNTPFGVERQPDGPGAPGPVAMWSGTGTTPNLYQIDLRGVEYVPAPGAAVLLGLGGLMATRRRRG